MKRSLTHRILAILLMLIVFAQQPALGAYAADAGPAYSPAEGVGTQIPSESLGEGEANTPPHNTPGEHTPPQSTPDNVDDGTGDNDPLTTPGPIGDPLPEGGDELPPAEPPQAPPAETVDIHGRIVFMGVDASRLGQIDLALYANGARENDRAPVLEPEDATFPTWQYSFDDLPAQDEQGMPYTYTVQASGYTGDGDTAFFLCENGRIVTQGASQPDFIYVRLLTVSGEYRVEREDEIPAPETVSLTLDTRNAADSAYLPGADSASLTSEDTSWAFAGCPQYNPLTGNEIEYRAVVEENAEGYEAEYINASAGESAQAWALDGGTIVNRYVGDGLAGMGIQALDGELEPTVAAEGTVTFVVRVNWNDNKNAKNDRPTDLPLTLYYLLPPDITEPAALTAEMLEALGWTDSIEPVVAKDGEYNYWTYTYTLPEKLVVYEGDEPVSEATFSYSFDIADEAALETDYFIEYGSDGKSVMCTRKTELSIHKVWKDSENKYHTRPNESALSGSLTLYRSYTTPSTGTVEDTIGLLSSASLSDMVEIDASGDSWRIDISDLPEYDPSGNPYTYYVRETGTLDIAAGNTLDDDGSVTYAASYVNEGNYTDRRDECYADGKLVNTLSDTIDYEATKQWQDDGTETRPTGMLSLYRYPNIDGRSYETATPVSGEERVLNTNPVDDKYAINFDSLPRFDEEGNEYVYFVQEEFTGGPAGNYTRFYKYGAEDAKITENALYNGGTLQNRRTGTTDIPVTKTWKAAARQDMVASVTLLVERRLENENDDAFEPVRNTSGLNADGEYTLEGFRAEVMELTQVFAGLPQFNDEGLPYKYRVTEKAVTINGDEFDLSDGTQSGNITTCVIDGYTFEMSQTTDASGAVTLTNRLVGDTEVRAKKVWNGTHEIHPHTDVTINVYRDGTFMDSYTIVEGDSAEKVLDRFPRYDSEGREYRYTVTENPVTGYHTTYTTVRDEEHPDGVALGVVQTTITNTPVGEGRHVEVTKQWLDDGDENCRREVTVGLYHDNGDGTWTQVRTGTLNAGNDWTTWLALDMDLDEDYTKYYVRELYVTHEGTNYYLAAADEDDEYPDLSTVPINPTPIGTLTTDAHMYNSYAYTNIGKTSYTFQNVRTSTVDIALEKNWNDDEYHEYGIKQEVTLEIRRWLNYTDPDDYTVVETVTLDGTIDVDGEYAVWKAAFDPLPKYDENGVLYHYRVVETKVKETETAGNPVHTVNGGYTLSDGHRYSVSVNDDRKYGEHNAGAPQPDDYTFTVTNARSQTIDFKVYKVWQDLIRSGETRTRPDIYLTLYKTIDNITTKVTPYVERVWRTTGAFNDYYWECDFNALQRYTNDGKEIIYSVEESMPFAGEYKTYYYDGSPEKVTGTDAESLAVIVPGIDIYDATGDVRTGDVLNNGTIVNRREGERYLTGQKIWENVPPGVSDVDLPAIKLQLQIFRYDETAEDYIYTGVDGYAEVSLITGKQNFTFGEGAAQYLSKYDDYGVFIKYQAKEVSGLTPGYRTPVYDDYNLTVTNRYNVDEDPEMVSVSVTKQWEDVPVGLDSSQYPTATVELWRCMVDELGDRPGTHELVTTKTITYAPSNTGSATFADFPKYGYNGRPFRYYVKEALNGYDTDISEDKDTIDLLETTGEGENKKYTKEEFEYDITNTYTGIGSDYIRLGGTKAWSDNNNLHGKRPANLNGKLRVWRAVGGVPNSAVDITDSVDITWPVDSGNTWSYVVKAKSGAQDPDVGDHASGGDLYRYAYNGSPYIYYVEEISPNHHYTGAVAVGGGTNVTTIGTHSVAAGDVAAQGSVAGNGNVTASFKNTLKTVGCDTTKTWLKVDAEGELVPLKATEFAMMLPESVTFELQYYDTDDSEWKPYTAVAERTMTRAQCIAVLDINGTMTVAFTGLPEFADDVDVAMLYRIVETKINGTAISGMTGGYTMAYTEPAGPIKNTLETIPLTITKDWEDENNQDGTRPTSITFKIVRDGDNASAITVTLSAPDWDPVTVYVPKYKANGDESTYTVEEQLTLGQKAEYQLQGVETGVYTLSTPGLVGGDKVFDFTNMHNTREISITATKTWSDAVIDTTIGAANRDDIQPTSVIVTLQRKDSATTGVWETVPNDGTALAAGETATVTLSTGNWSYTWTELQSRHNSSLLNNTMAQYQFRVVETDAAGVVSDFPAYTPKYSITSTYSATPVAVDDSDCVADNVAISIRNDLDTVSLPVSKVWDNGNGEFTKREPVVLQLMYRKAGEGDEDWKPGSAPTLTLSASSTPTPWAGTFTNLPKEDKDGTAYQYTVKELSISGIPLAEGKYPYSYSTEVSGGTVTNKLVARNDITVEKVWDDVNNQDGLQAPVTVVLKKDVGVAGEADESAAVTLGGSNPWTHTWENLPKYQKDGVTPAVYTVVETSAPAQYTTQYSLDGENYTDTCGNIPDTAARTVYVKNSHTPKKMNLTVTKVWEDDEDRFVMRPDDGVRFRLMSTTNTDGETGAAEVNDSLVLVDNDTSTPWTHTWEDLPVREGGKDIYYSVVELCANGDDAPIPGYTSPTFIYTKAAGSNGTVVTDTAIAGSVNDVDGTTHTATVTNTLDTVEVTVEKQWADTNNIYGSRPYSLEFTLQWKLTGDADSAYENVVDKNGPVKKTLLRTDNPQSVVFDGLPKTDLYGNVYQYRALETGYAQTDISGVTAITPNTPDVTSGYFMSGALRYDFTSSTAAVTGGYKTTAINTLLEEKISLSGTKTWVDDQDYYHSRPEPYELTLTLYRKKPLDTDWETYPGSYTVVWTEGEGDDAATWAYTIEDLPRYVINTTTVWEYSVVETAPTYYTQTSPATPNVTGTPDGTTGFITGADLTNSLFTSATLVVTKETDYGPDTMEFTFTVHLSSEAIDDDNPILYTGGYEVYAYDDTVMNTPISTGTTLADGKITITPLEKFVLKGLPSGYYYSVVEDEQDGYELNEGDSENLSGQLGTAAGATATVKAVNDAFTELAIENNTENHDTGETNAGGKVAIVVGTDEEPSEYDEDDYKRDQLAVVWAPEEYWELGDTFTIVYTEFGEADEKTLIVSDYLNDDGTLKAFEDCTFDDEAAAQRFKDDGASLTWADEDEGVVKLVLSTDVTKMPRKTRVHVQFIPTLAVSNATDDYAGTGGTVMVDGGQDHVLADGVPDLGDGVNEPYKANAVTGTAQSGYRVQSGGIAIRNLNALGEPSVPLTIQSDGSFSAQLTTMIAGEPATVLVTGRVEYTTASGSNTGVRIIFDVLPVPLQVDIVFETIPATRPDRDRDRDDDGRRFLWRNFGWDMMMGPGIIPDGEVIIPPEYELPVQYERTPKTGDDTPILAVLIIGLLTGLGAFLLRKKKQDKGEP